MNRTETRFNLLTSLVWVCRESDSFKWMKVETINTLTKIKINRRYFSISTASVIVAFLHSHISLIWEVVLIRCYPSFTIVYISFTIQLPLSDNFLTWCGLLAIALTFFSFPFSSHSHASKLKNTLFSISG